MCTANNFHGRKTPYIIRTYIWEEYLKLQCSLEEESLNWLIREVVAHLENGYFSIENSAGFADVLAPCHPNMGHRGGYLYTPDASWWS